MPGVKGNSIAKRRKMEERKDDIVNLGPEIEPA